MTVQTAQQLILKHQSLSPVVKMDIGRIFGMILAEDIEAPIPLPVFSNSAMDGFALRFEDTQKAGKNHPVRLSIQEELWAGKVPEHALQSGECSKIMTGACLPEGANAVVMQEIVSEEAGDLVVFDPVPKADNIRFAGEELQRGDFVLSRGTRVTPAVVGLLASLGFREVAVFARPRVAIVPTGSEIVKAGQHLHAAQIYESNAQALAVAVREAGAEPLMYDIVPDDRGLLQEVTQKALQESSHVLICGGVSVGDRDYNKSVLGDCQVQEIFWKVAQKPGKPLYFGIRENVGVFGLPGNPVSSLCCFYEYVRPALLVAMGYTLAKGETDPVFLPCEKARLKQTTKKKSGRLHFVRGRVSRQAGSLFVEPLRGQGSHMLTSFAGANCFIVLPEQGETFHAGDEVTVHLLPQTREFL